MLTIAGKHRNTRIGNVAGIQYLGVYKLIKYSYDPSKFPAKCNLSVITHEMHFTGRTLNDSEHHIAIPNQDVCIVINLTAASGIERPSNSRVIMYDEELYYYLTWTDISENSKHGKARGLSRQHDGKRVAYLRLAPQDHYEKVLEVLSATLTSSETKNVL